MKTNVSLNEIDKLERTLNDFQEEWEDLQVNRDSKWRIYFLISSVIVFLIVFIDSSFWWLGMIVIGYFAGSLFSMLRHRAKTSHQILEHQKQLKLVRLLRNFQASPYNKRPQHNSGDE